MDDQAASFLEMFDQQWERYRKQFKAARKDLADESVHDLRVAARRLLSLLGILRSLDTHARVNNLRRLVKKQLDELDELRDTQVMLEESTRRLDTLPQMSMFQRYMQENLHQFARRAQKDIRASRPSDLKPRIRRIRRVAEKHSDETTLLDHLEQAVDEAHARTTRAFGDLNSQDPVSIHRVRVAFKKFRYMIEAIQPLLPGYPEGCLDRMHDYQDAMGRVHDVSVLLDRSKAFAGSQPQAASFELGPIEAWYQQRLRELTRAYFDRKDEFNTFWRAAPDRPFPWEQSNEPVHRAPRDRRDSGRTRQRRRRQPPAPH